MNIRYIYYGLLCMYSLLYVMFIYQKYNTYHEKRGNNHDRVHTGFNYGRT
jgi:hypothetical protein